MDYLLETESVDKIGTEEIFILKLSVFIYQYFPCSFTSDGTQRQSRSWDVSVVNQ